jgi:WD40 repeat protein
MLLQSGKDEFPPPPPFSIPFPFRGETMLRWIKGLFAKPISFSLVSTFNVFDSSCKIIKVSQNGDMIAIHNIHKRKLIIVDSKFGNVITSMDTPQYVFDFTFLGDGKSLLMCGDHGVLKRSIDSGDSVDIGEKGRPIYTLSVDKDGRYFATGGKREVCIWNLETGELICRITTVFQPCPKLLPGRKQVLVGGRGAPLAIYDITKGSIINNNYSTLPSDFSTMMMEIATEKQYIVMGSSSGHLLIWNLARTSPLLDVELGRYAITSLAVSKDCSFIALVFASLEGSIPMVWNGGKQFFQSEINSLSHSLALSPDGSRIYSANHDGTVTVWDVCQ